MPEQIDDGDNIRCDTNCYGLRNRIQSIVVR